MIRVLLLHLVLASLVVALALLAVLLAGGELWPAGAVVAAAGACGGAWNYHVTGDLRDLYAAVPGTLGVLVGTVLLALA